MNTKSKWYNDPQLVGTLLIMWPPFGLYGLYKSEAIELKWKKIACGALALVGMLLAAKVFF